MIKILTLFTIVNFMIYKAIKFNHIYILNSENFIMVQYIKLGM